MTIDYRQSVTKGKWLCKMMSGLQTYIHIDDLTCAVWAASFFHVTSESILLGENYHDGDNCYQEMCFFMTGKKT